MTIARNRPARPARPAAPALPSFAALDETHRQIMQILAELERLPGLLAQPGSGPEAAALAERACKFFCGAAREHHEAEETFVFPSLLAGAGADGELRAHVQRLQQDHHWFEEDWLEIEPHLQAVAQGWRREHLTFLRAALPEFTALQHEHIALEESLIYPEAKRRQAAAGTPA
jgi:hemerythrin-like domain-containing protein